VPGGTKASEVFSGSTSDRAVRKWTEKISETIDLRSFISFCRAADVISSMSRLTQPEGWCDAANLRLNQEHSDDAPELVVGLSRLFAKFRIGIVVLPVPPPISRNRYCILVALSWCGQHHTSVPGYVLLIFWGGTVDNTALRISFIDVGSIDPFTVLINVFVLGQVPRTVADASVSSLDYCGAALLFGKVFDLSNEFCREGIPQGFLNRVLLESRIEILACKGIA